MYTYTTLRGDSSEDFLEDVINNVEPVVEHGNSVFCFSYNGMVNFTIPLIINYVICYKQGQAFGCQSKMNQFSHWGYSKLYSRYLW